MIVVPVKQSHAVMAPLPAACTGVYFRIRPEVLLVSCVDSVPIAVTLITPLATVGAWASSELVFEQPACVWSVGITPFDWKYSATEVLHTPAMFTTSVTFERIVKSL